MNGDSKRSAASNTPTSVVSAAVVCALSADSLKVQPQLHDFQIPVAEAAPEELVNEVRRIVEAIVLRAPGLPSPASGSAPATIQRASSGASVAAIGSAEQRLDQPRSRFPPRDPRS